MKESWFWNLVSEVDEGEDVETGRNMGRFI